MATKMTSDFITAISCEKRCRVVLRHVGCAAGFEKRKKGDFSNRLSRAADSRVMRDTAQIPAAAEAS